MFIVQLACTTLEGTVFSLSLPPGPPAGDDGGGSFSLYVSRIKIQDGEIRRGAEKECQMALAV